MEKACCHTPVFGQLDPDKKEDQLTLCGGIVLLYRLDILDPIKGFGLHTVGFEAIEVP